MKDPTTCGEQAAMTLLIIAITITLAVSKQQ